MKRGYEENASTSVGPPQSRVRFNPPGVAAHSLISLTGFPPVCFFFSPSRGNFSKTHFIMLVGFLFLVLVCIISVWMLALDACPNESLDESTRNLARRVAEHYSARTNQTLEEREASPIIHLKKLNNWVKSVLIQIYARRGDAVLDLACGKGGDLIKWDKAKIGYYVGIDIAEGSRKKVVVRLDRVLKDDAPFDICSCQFALHYSWSTEARARRALANVSALLRPGGTFIGTMPDANVIIKKLREAEGLSFGSNVYWICFDDEYGEKYHLELIFVKNFHEFVDEYLKKPEFAELMRRLGALGDGSQEQSTLSPEEWDVAYLYLAFVLRKRGQPDPNRRGYKGNNGQMQISKDGILYLNNEE
ncbi:hypothetical protein ACLOJK_020448 [Asimina triloba]